MRTGTLISCQACRIRKVRCSRDSPDEDCIKCREKGIACVTAAKEVKRRRTGKRIESARLLYGDSESSSPAPENSSLLSPYDISLFSLENALSETEMASSAAAEFLQLFVNENKRKAPVLDWERVRETYHTSGRRMERLKPDFRALAAVAIAHSARGSNHPLLLGKDAPNISELAIANRQDLSQWGLRREGICQRLLQQAVEISEQSGIFRKSSAEGLVCLMYAARILMILLDAANSLEDLHDYDDIQLQRGRPFATAAAGHARELVMQDPLHSLDSHLNLQGGSPGIMLMMRDIYSSALSGRPLNLTPEDRELLWDDNESFTADPDRVLDGIYGRENRWFNLVGICVKYCRLGLYVFEYITSMKAKRLDFSEQRIWKAWDLMDELESLCNNMLAVTRQVPPEVPNRTLYEVTLISIVLSATAYSCIINREISRRLHPALSSKDLVEVNYPVWTSSSNGPPSSLRGIQNLSALHVLRTTTQICRTIINADPICYGDFDKVFVIKPNQLFIEIRYTINHLLSILPAEHGGPEELPLHVKVRMCRELLLVAEKIGWAYGSASSLVFKLNMFLHAHESPVDKVVGLGQGLVTVTNVGNADIDYSSQRSSCDMQENTEPLTPGFDLPVSDLQTLYNQISPVASLPDTAVQAVSSAADSTTFSLHNLQCSEPPTTGLEEFLDTNFQDNFTQWDQN